MKKDSVVWFDGELKENDKVYVHLLNHSINYGSAVFEGIRAYETARGPAVFRLAEHVERFFNSAKIYSMEINFSKSDIERAILSVVKANGLSSCYVRPLCFYNDEHVGVNTTGKNVSVFIAAVPLPSYFDGKKSDGIKCKISSWHRISSDILPVQAKASGNYLNSIIASNEARSQGFDEAILLSSSGCIAEGSGENVFLVKNGVLETPDEGSDILLGITRDTVMKIGEYKGIKVIDRKIHREELYTADEVFLSGTAAEITPVTAVDGIDIKDGKEGPVTKRIKEEYFDIVIGKDKRFLDWLSFVK